MKSRELGTVLRQPLFRRLIAVRFTGQFSDGLFQSALATFILFSPERQATPAAIAVAFVILYIPYSVIGPFAGVFLDRWDRRRTLWAANLVRAAIVVGICGLTVAGRDGLDLGIVVLVALGINRFVLAGLSASVPHTVPRSALITANAFAPTAGTLCAAIGGLVGVVGRGLVGGGDFGSAIILIAAACGFALSGLLALRFRARSLGPDGAESSRSFTDVFHELVDGARVVRAHRDSWRAITVVTIHRLGFGAITLVAIIMVRNTLTDTADPDAALAKLSLVVGATAGGALLAAVLTPSLVRRIGVVRWTVFLLLAAGIMTPVGAANNSLQGLIVGGLFLGMAGQGLKISADTTVQREIADDHLGRVFALYDMAVNCGLAAGVVVAASLAAVTTSNSAVLVGFAVTFVAAAWWYRRGRTLVPGELASRADAPPTL